MIPIIGIVLVVLLLLYVIVTYNGLVRLRNRIQNAWAQIDVQLRRRYDLIPNLVETVKSYAAHERETLDAVVQARAGAVSATGSPASQAAAEGPLIGALRQLFAVSEQYPALKANENFLSLQHELAVTEDRLQAARRFYNANVQDYNRRVESFPSNVIASQFRFTQEQFFEIDAAVRAEVAAPPQVGFS